MNEYREGNKVSSFFYLSGAGVVKIENILADTIAEFRIFTIHGAEELYILNANMSFRPQHDDRAIFDYSQFNTSCIIPPSNKPEDIEGWKCKQSLYIKRARSFLVVSQIEKVFVMKNFSASNMLMTNQPIIKVTYSIQGQQTTNQQATIYHLSNINFANLTHIIWDDDHSVSPILFKVQNRALSYFVNFTFHIMLSHSFYDLNSTQTSSSVLYFEGFKSIVYIYDFQINTIMSLFVNNGIVFSVYALELVRLKCFAMNEILNDPQNYFPFVKEGGCGWLSVIDKLKIIESNIT